MLRVRALLVPILVGVVLHVGACGGVDVGAGGLYVADFGNATLRRIDLASKAVVTYAGVVDQAGIVPGVAPTAHVNRSTGIAWLPTVGLLATMPSENSVVLVTP